MPVRNMKKQLQALRPESRRRRKLSQKSVASLHERDLKLIPSSTPASSDVKGQSTATLHPQYSSEEPKRKRSRVQQWLVHQAQRLDRLKQGTRGHRDSMFDQVDVEKELKLASQNANAIVSGPGGEPIDQRVIDHFFLLYQACGSDWRDSTRWELHQAKCLQMQCDICRGAQYPTKTLLSPPKAPSSPSTRSSSPKSPKSIKRQRVFEDGYFSIPQWCSSSRKRKEKGKSPATNEETQDVISDFFVGDRIPAREPLSKQQRKLSKRLKGNIVIRDAVRRTQEKPVLCSVISKPLKSSQIPVPAVPDLKPADSSALDLANLAHVTGRPYEACPLEEGQLPFPLTKKFLPPPTPELRSERCISPTPEPSPVSSVDGVFVLSPFASPSPSATNIQGESKQTIRLVDPCADEIRAMIDDLGHDVSMPRIKKRRPSVAAHMHRRPAPSLSFPPTPPDSRHNSSSYPEGVSFTACGGVAKPEVMSEAPPDRVRTTCKLIGTTGSSLPDCSVYLRPREMRHKRWTGTAKRDGLGVNKWR